ncbi:Uncharacterized conserved protein YndB, AHSA1/START domain [[Luteovulum] sphaeroides subsp. megalophilum]|uniref:SRPBCC family protein n=1 Tax=Cereibacter sphaeroides TaxID=1063 RepID=UPI000B740FD6|nr:SRPBCC domain-containing protein [Cereibacter sphaeroides]SNS35396.1 Uncharacterized conserved protein YndB, AHSA1/START domain [[Luteovulum] sphaeroides subsp. megalophilum]
MADEIQIGPGSAARLEFRRHFAAPPEQLWAALTSPALLPAWLFARGWPMTECSFEPHKGGLIRQVWTGPEGRTRGLTGRVILSEPPHRLIHSELYDEDWTGGETLVTLQLLPVEGGTELAMAVDYATPEARDAVAASAMAAEMEEAYRHLDLMLAA